MVSIGIYNGSHWVTNHSRGTALLQAQLPIHGTALTHIPYSINSGPDKADIIVIPYSASDHIPYITSLFENYKDALFIISIGENMYRKQPLFAKYVSVKVTYNKRFLPLFHCVYSIAAHISFFSYASDMKIAKVLTYYANKRSLLALLTQSAEDMARVATDDVQFVNFPLFSRLMYTHFSGIAQNIPKRISHYAPAHSRKKFCCTVFSNTTPQRIKICKMLLSIAPVDVFGKNPLSQGSPETITTFSSLLELYSQYRFVICFENSVQESYITEKLYNVLRSGAVPIYFGASDVCKYVNADAVLHVNKTSMRHIVTKVEQLERNTHMLEWYAHAPHFTDVQKDHIEKQWAQYDKTYQLLHKYIQSSHT